MRTTFEHRYAEADNHKLLMDLCNTFGAEGWELVHVEVASGAWIGLMKRIAAPPA